MTTRPVSPLGDRYRLDDRIGAGGMGEVWRATDVVLNRPVAVKLLRPELTQHEDDLARFRAEARSAASVPHPCIVQVYDYCEDDSCGRPYLVMELVDGKSLDRLLDSQPLGAAPTLRIIAQAAQGLAVAHGAGLVHRDVKPQNLLVTPNGQVKITDFGIARAAGSAPVTGAGMMLGTPAYLAPERAMGQAATPAADLYALGIVAYRCLAGRLPFTGEPLAVMLACQQQPLPSLPPSVPPEVAALVAQLTAKDPRARPAGAAQVAARARQLHAALATMATPPGALAAGPSGTPPGALAAGPSATAEEPLLGTFAASTRRRNRDRPGRRQQRHRPAVLAGRMALALASVGAIGVTGWMLAHASTVPATHQLPPRPAAITDRPDLHPVRAAPHHHRLVAAGRPKTTAPAVTAPAYQAPAAPPRRSRRSHTPAPTPTSHPATRTPSPAHTTSGTPTPTPTATPSPSGTPSPTATPSPSGTPSPTLTPSGGTAASTTPTAAAALPTAVPSMPVPASSGPSG